MKIALITWFDNENYGTALQAYALKKILSNYGTCDIIPYMSPTYKYTLQDIIVPSKRKVLLDNVIYKMYFNIFRDRLAQPIKNKQRKFIEFFSKYLEIDECYRSYERLKAINGTYDVYVCGSDQIWNPNFFDPMFFLQFVQNGKKISYAPSFGVSSLNDYECRQNIKDLLLGFDYISVREKSGQTIIKELINREVPVCLDPTLLIKADEWDGMSNASNFVANEPYVYCLLLGNNKSHRLMVQNVSRYLGIQIKYHPYTREDFFESGDKLLSLSPVDFICAIKKSSFVCTDSFHATVFAILFHKPFICYSRFLGDDSKSQNSRVENLLDSVGLIDRLDMNSDDMGLLMNVNYERVDEKISSLIDQSFHYLNIAMK